jgi:hypothetical protein
MIDALFWYTELAAWVLIAMGFLSLLASATMQRVARMRQDITMVRRRKERQKASILPST